MGRLYQFCFLVIAATAAFAANGPFPAFPGAEGAGAFTPGGRGGKVYVVTTLEDFHPGKEKAIPGSLRAAILAKGPRIVTFAVSGYIDLHAKLDVKEPFLTIDGEKAPGDGICLRNWTLDIGTHDVIVRYLRVRPGDRAGKELDGVSCSGQNVIFDHCSVSFGIDETLSTNGDSGNVTVQWCNITESLNKSLHHKGAHGYGSLISGSNPITYHHNLYAFHRSRNPRPGIGQLDFRNNVIYGWGDWAGYCGNDALRMNYVANYLRPLSYSRDQQYAFRPGGLLPRVYIADNFFFGAKDATRDNVLLVRAPDGGAPDDATGKSKKYEGSIDDVKKILVTKPFPASTVTSDAAEKAFERVIKEGGATLPVRDEYDARIAQLVREGKGRIIDKPEDVGGWPELKSGEAPADADSDGMPDAWEKKSNLNPDDAADAAKDCNGDGFTNIEKYLYNLEPRKPFAWIYPPVVGRVDETQIAGTAHIKMASATPGAEIRYTLDGSEPTKHSTRYKEPIDLAQSATVRAKTFSKGAESYITNENVTVYNLHEAAKVEKLEPGLVYSYYEAGDWRGFPVNELKPVKTGTTENIGIGPSDKEFGYGLKFDGYVRVPVDGVYTFYGHSDQLGRILVDDEELILCQSRRRVIPGRIGLKAGLHKFEASIYFRSEGSERTFEALYEGPGIQKQLIPPSAYVRAAR